MSTIKLTATGGGGGTVSLKAPAATQSNGAVELTLPTDDGTANQYLKTDGSGALSFATVAGGLTEVDSWQVDTDFSYTSGKVNLTANWARSSMSQMANGSNLGTGMTQSSGVFTFPSTGFWRIDFRLHGYVDDARKNFEAGIRIPSGDEWTQGYPSLIDGGTGNWHQEIITWVIVDITDTSAQTVAFFTYANGAYTVVGNGGQLRTGAIFMKLADT